MNVSNVNAKHVQVPASATLHVCNSPKALIRSSNIFLKRYNVNFTIFSKFE